MELQDILEHCGITEEFTLDVAEEVKMLSTEITPKELAKRRDLTNETIITIDGDDAKDLDDAVSCTKIKGKKYLLGVHIADVSHYVKEDGAIDMSAMERGTSVYFPNKVIPMLPTALSNSLCSLTPESAKLTLSCFMTISSRGDVLDYEICESYIKTAYRMTYNQVTGILEGDMLYRKRYNDIIPQLETMRELALILRDKRAKRGSIDFNFPENKIVMNGEDIIGINRCELSLSNHIIEEFMLCANETVAKHMMDNKLPSLFRIHEQPDEERIEKLRSLSRLLGYKFKSGKKVTPKDIQNLLFSVDDNVKDVISVMALRSMMKACYNEENLGHFGLAADYYCHFTSPIRRYPDLFVHRVLKYEIKGKGKIAKTRIKILETKAKKLAVSTTECEIKATEAERDWTKYLICKYMETYLGCDFYSTITSVTEFGVFARLDNSAEGLLPVNCMKDDYYTFDNESLTLRGERTGKIYSVGDVVKIKISAVNLISAQLTFTLADQKDIDKKNAKINKAKYYKKKKSSKPKIETIKPVVTNVSVEITKPKKKKRRHRSGKKHKNSSAE